MMLSRRPGVRWEELQGPITVLVFVLEKYARTRRDLYRLCDIECSSSVVVQIECLVVTYEP